MNYELVNTEKRVGHYILSKINFVLDKYNMDAEGLQITSMKSKTIKTVGITLRLGKGTSIFVRGISESYNEALDKAVNRLEVKLRKRKDRIRNPWKIDLRDRRKKKIYFPEYLNSGVGENFGSEYGVDQAI
jgi:ribosome-associated translation inhibitor RaiA